MSIDPLPTAPSTADPTNFQARADPFVAALSTLQVQVNAALAALGTFPMAPAMGRVTLTPGLPVTITDVTAAATLYYSPYVGNFISIWNGAAWTANIFTELSLVLDSNSGHTGYHQSGKNFDVFVFLNPSAPTLGTGPAWTSDTARGTGAGTTELERYQGLWVNKNAITIRFGNASGNTVSVAAREATYVGTIRTTADGQTEDSKAKRFVWNTFNRVKRPMLVTEPMDSWPYSTAAYRQMNANAANQLAFVRGLDEDLVRADVIANFANSNAGIQVSVGIGLDSATVNSATAMGRTASASASAIYPASAQYVGNPGLGYHYMPALEWSGATPTTTWYGDGGSPSIIQSGIFGAMAA